MFYKDNLDDEFDSHCTDTKLKFVFLPKRCQVSGKHLWLEYAYRKTSTYTGPGDPVVEHRWYDKHEYVIEKLKGGRPRRPYAR